MSEENKICKICGLLKSITEFREYRTKNTLRYRTECKNCEKEYRSNNKEKIKEYRSNNKEKIKEYQKEYQKEYRSNNKEKIKEYQKEYKSNNRDKINKRDNNRRKEDLGFKLRRNISWHVWQALKSKNSSKNNKSILQYLPYDIETTLKEHLIKQFSNSENLTPDGKVWMTEFNQGKYSSNRWDDNDPTTWFWQLDHIIPQSGLPYDSYDHPNFKKCWALENLRPLSAKQNLLDGASKIRHKKDE